MEAANMSLKMIQLIDEPLQKFIPQISLAEIYTLDYLIPQRHSPYEV